MSTHSAGDRQVSERLQRHFLLLGVIPPNNESFVHAFSAILEWKLNLEYFPDEVIARAGTMAAATMKAVQLVSEALPQSPSRPQNAVGASDAARIIEGVLMIHDETKDFQHGLGHIWAHECLRALYDRCSSEDDRAKALAGITAAAKSFPYLSQSLAALRNPTLLFTDLWA
ncbi:unnamed protein product, partial [Polarella glacialis]